MGVPLSGDVVLSLTVEPVASFRCHTPRKASLYAAKLSAYTSFVVAPAVRARPMPELPAAVIDESVTVQLLPAPSTVIDEPFIRR